MITRVLLILLFWGELFLLKYHIIFAQTNEVNSVEGCTIGVAAGKATADGRPLLWKTRDYASEPDNEVKYNTSYRYNFIAVVNAGEVNPWMGVNEKGFAIINSLSTDLPARGSGPGNGEVMREALGTCAVMDEFIELLDRTNVTGRTTRANFGVIDTTGGAVIFETGGDTYWKFDAKDTNQAPYGYVLRTNFSINGGGSEGIERYRRQVKLIGDFYSGDSLNYRNIIRTQMRDFSDSNSDPVPVPYPDRWQFNRPFGYIYCYKSICRSTSVSAAVIRGVLPDESAKLSTMYTMLGQPASSIAVPYWPIGKSPTEADGNSTAPLCDVANQIKTLLFDYAESSHYIDSYKLRDEDGNGIWTRTFPAEDSIFTAADMLLAKWRINPFSTEEMLAAETNLAHYALSILKQTCDKLTTSINGLQIAETAPNDFALAQNYPNPFNSTTSIQFSLPMKCRVELKIFDMLGKEVSTITSQEYNAGKFLIQWQATNISSGIYFYHFQAQPTEFSNIATFVKANRLTVIK